MRAGPKNEQTVHLSDTLVFELHRLLGLAGPTEDTLVLLFPKYRKKYRKKSKSTRAGWTVALHTTTRVVVAGAAVVLLAAMAVQSG
jgi:hypothetical protein